MPSCRHEAERGDYAGYFWAERRLVDAVGPSHLGAATEKGSFLAYEPAWSGGVFVAAGGVDATAPLLGQRIITGTDQGGGPHVRTFSVNTCPVCATSFQAQNEWFAYDPALASGVSVAGGDIDSAHAGDEVLTVPARSAASHVRIWNAEGAGASENRGFYAYEPWLSPGFFVAGGTLPGLGRVVTAPGQGGPDLVRVLSADGVLQAEWCVFGCA